MKEIYWNSGYYREGGTVIWDGDIKRIKSLEVFEDRSSPNLFDWVPVLKIHTECGRTLEFEEN